MDQRDRDEEAKTESERDGDGASERIRPGNARERERKRRRPRAPEARGVTLQEEAEDGEQQESGDDAGRDRGGDGALLGCGDREREQGEPGDRRSRGVAPRRRLRLVGEMGAHQHGRRNRGGAAERPQHEQHHGQKPGERRRQKRQGVRLERERDWQRIAIDGREQRGRERADDEPDGDADGGEEKGLDQIDGENLSACGAEAFERGDDLALLDHVALDRVADADTAEKKGREPDEVDELGEAVGLAAKRGRGVGPIADGEARLQEFALDLAAGGGQCVLVARGGGGKLHAVSPADEAAGLHQARLRERLARHEQLRSVSEAVGEPVRLLAKNAADRDGGLADRKRASDR